MKVRFDQVRVDVAPDAADISVANAADTIIATNRALLVAAAVGSGGQECNRIVAEYGKCLKGVLLLIVRQSALYDAAVLPFDKATIKTALVDSVRQQLWSEAECALLGNLYFYLSYFREGLAERGDEMPGVLLVEQRAEGAALRAEWQRLVPTSKPSRFSQFLPSWLKH